MEGYEVPAFGQRFFWSNNSEYAFKYKTVPQTHAALINNGVIPQINNTVYILCKFNRARAKKI